METSFPSGCSGCYINTTSSPQAPARISAQFLIFAATLLGVDIAVERIKQLLNKKDEKNE
jgi:hypothetical protein